MGSDKAMTRTPPSRRLVALVAALALPLPGLSVALILPAGPALAQGGKAQGGAHRGGGRSETGGRGGRDTGAERGGARGGRDTGGGRNTRSEEHTSELQSRI